jgi:hypothetical protein
MPSASTRANILLALASRLEGITTANAWPQWVKKVFVDDIPMGLDLPPHQLPAIIVLDDQDFMNHQHQSLDCSWKIELQLVLEKCPDSKVHELIRSVAKAIYAGHPTMETNGGFRFHPAVTWVQMQAIHADLHMIKANRLASMEIIVHYRVKPWDM